MNKFLARVREPITAIIGLAIIIVTLISWYNGVIPFLYDCLAGLCTGAVFFLIPDKLVNLILSILRKLTNKLLNGKE